MGDPARHALQLLQPDAVGAGGHLGEEPQQGLDGAVGHLAQPARLPVVASTEGEPLVTSALQHRIRHRLDPVVHR